MKIIPRNYQVKAAVTWYDALDDIDAKPVAAVPTGGGKTVIMSMLISLILEKEPDASILVLSHTREILEQDYEALLKTLTGWSDIEPDDIGLYVAGLDKREVRNITVGGIHSVYNKDIFKYFDYYIVDECHTVNHKDTGMYRHLLDDVNGRVTGMSATIYRTGHGYVYEGDDCLFNTLACDLTTSDDIKGMMEDGYLSPLVGADPDLLLDVEGIKKTGGDFNQKALVEKFDRNSVTDRAVQETIFYGETRKKWLIFAIDTAHANHITRALRKANLKQAKAATYLDNMGTYSKDINKAIEETEPNPDYLIKVDVLHTKIKGDRAEIIDNFKNGNTRCLVSVGMVTTGFDAPNVDMLVLLRPTESAVLHVQMLGRGLRVAPGKENCLVVDFADNIGRLGPIDDVSIPHATNGDGVAPTNECEHCSWRNHLSAVYCLSCGAELKEPKTCPECEQICVPGAPFCPYCEYVFPDREVKIADKPTGAQAVRGYSGRQRLKVKTVQYNIHKKANGTPTLLVTYHTEEGNKVKDWVCLDHTPGEWPKVKADHWVNSRGYEGQLTVADVFENRHQLKEPDYITVDFDGKFINVVKSEFPIQFINV